MPSHDHDHQAPNAHHPPARCAVLTISDTRSEATDESGPRAVQALEAAGHEVVDRAIATDEPDAIADRLERWLADPKVQVVVTTGGTGLGVRDHTIDVVRVRLTAELPGFGELFRMLSYQQVQSAAMLSTALGGLVVRPQKAGGETFVFCLPGSTKAVGLAIDELIGPQLKHLIQLRQP